MSSRTDFTYTLHDQWTRKRGELGCFALLVGVILIAISSIVVYESSSDVVFRVGALAAVCAAVCGISLAAFVALSPRPVPDATEIGHGSTFAMTAPTRWASAVWLWSGLVSGGLSFIGVGLSYAIRVEVISFNAGLWLMLGAAGVGASIFSPLRYIGRFRIDIERDGIRMELGRAYSGYVRWADIESVEPAARGRYALDLVLKPGVRVENTSQWSPLYRLWAGVITEASPFHDGYVRLECGGWTGDKSALLEEIVHHVPTPDVLDPEAADT